MSKKIALVTGGAGFLGSHLCVRLIDDGYHVICLDNFLTGSEENLSGCLGRDDFELVTHDVCEPYFVDHVDEIYNLACPASPIHYQHDPIFTTKTNVMGSLNMLGLAKRTGARLFQASTSEVYGDPNVHPQKESYWGHVNPHGIRACYDEGKRCAESLCFDYHREHGVQIRVGRIFNTYGPNMHPNDGRVVSNFIVQAINGEPITIYGDGEQTRSFCYVSDLVEVIIRLMRSDAMGPMNIGNPGEFTIRELAQEVVRLTGSHSPLIYESLPSDDPKQRKPDITFAQQALGWRPQVALKEGLSETISYFLDLAPLGNELGG